MKRRAFYMRFLSRLRGVADRPDCFSPQKREALLEVVGELVSHWDAYLRMRAVRTMLALHEADQRADRRRRRSRVAIAEVEEPDHVHLTKRLVPADGLVSPR